MDLDLSFKHGLNIALDNAKRYNLPGTTNKLGAKLLEAPLVPIRSKITYHFSGRNSVHQCCHKSPIILPIDCQRLRIVLSCLAMFGCAIVNGKRKDLCEAVGILVGECRLEGLSCSSSVGHICRWITSVRVQLYSIDGCEWCSFPPDWPDYL